MAVTYSPRFKYNDKIKLSFLAVPVKSRVTLIGETHTPVFAQSGKWCRCSPPQVRGWWWMWSALESRWGGRRLLQTDSVGHILGPSLPGKSGVLGPPGWLLGGFQEAVSFWVSLAFPQSRGPVTLPLPHRCSLQGTRFTVGLHGWHAL